ncbi:MAG: asparaginase [Chloroflexia bacterium]
MGQRLVLVATGGTIAMAADARAGGAVPVLHGQDLLSGLPEGLPPVETVEHSHLPSAHMTLEALWALRNRVRELALDPSVRGIVITHGTDTMEETAYLLDLTVEGEAPIVLTGSMRSASDPGYEGPGNLLAALRVAAAPEARGVGAVVVMEDEVHAAREVTKMHTSSPGAFRSPYWGPLGRVEGERVVLRWRPARHVLSCARLEERVLLIRLAVGMDDGLLRYALERGMRGVVIEALGGGRVPPWWMPTVREAIADGVAVVIASRCVAGRVGDRYGYAGACRELEAIGAIPSNGLSGVKARLKLMVALGAGLSVQMCREAFAREP